jgi:hypothetical protein
VNVNEHGTSHAEDALIVEVGSEYLEHGLVRVQAAPDGRVRIEKREQGKEQRFDGRIEETQVARLTDIVEGVRDARFGQRQGLPDEPRYRLLVVRGRKPVLEVEVWRSELSEAKELAAVIAELSEVAQRSSDGQALL